MIRNAFFDTKIAARGGAQVSRVQPTAMGLVWDYFGISLGDRP